VASLTRRSAARFRSDLDAAAGGLGLGMMRTRLRHWLEGHGVDGATAHDVLVAVGEACTNALEHAAVRAPGAHSPVRVEATMSRGCVRVRVVDRGRWVDRTGQPARENRGRGILLMKALVDEVRITTGRRGTTVNLIKRVPDLDPPGLRAARRRRPLASGLRRQLASPTPAPAPAPAPVQVDPVLDPEPSPPAPDD
jgi:anti-sigma regulatory factor (Ser/Thr protein kinase)